jgi:predicted CXXCH cytochrome family protein
MRPLARALIAAALLAALAACAPQTRYQVLSIFFDGVPPPPPPAGAAAPGGAAAPAPAPRPTVVRHAPYAKRQCNGCHEVSTNRLLAPVPELCFRCHDIGQKTRRRLHGPVLTGSCRFCHDPHTARYPSLLLAPPTEMCLYCHNPEDVYRNPLHKQGVDCARCHLVHADDRFFLRPELRRALDARDAARKRWSGTTPEGATQEGTAPEAPR